MAVNTYLQLVNFIDDFASQHQQIQRFKAEFSEQLPNFATENEAYPILFMAPIGTQFLTNVDTFSVRFYAFDIIQKDRNNINLILSDTNTILNDLKKWFTEGDNYNWQIIGDPQASPLNNALLDYAAGWTMDVVFNVASYCVDEIPFSGSPLISIDGIDNVYSRYLTCQTVTGCTTFQDYIANAIAGLGGTDVYVTGGTYSNGSATFTNTTGGTFTVSGFSTGGTSTDTYVTGFTFNPATYQLNLSQNNGSSFNADLSILSSDVTITGGTYNPSNGSATFTNNTGGTFTVTGFLTGATSNDMYWISGSTGTNSIKAINNTGLDATGDYAVAIGIDTISSGQASFAMGRTTEARGQAALSTGRATIALGDYSFAGGVSTEANGSNSFVFGDTSFANGNSTIVLGNNITGDDDNTVYVPNIQFDLNAPSTMDVGRMEWNDIDGTVDLRLKGNNVTLQIGQEQVVRVVNKTGGNLLESQYRAVRVRNVSEGGAQGQRLAVVLAQANSTINASDTIGLVTEDISNNQEGFVTLLGQVHNINTTGSLQGESWVDGDILYLSPTTAGGLTNVRPIAPNKRIVIGYVEYAHAINGKIYVNIQNGYDLNDLNNVLLSGTPTNGQALTYSTSLSAWTNTTISAGTSSHDTYVTGGTKTGSNILFTNNTGGTFTVTGITDTFVTGGTYSVPTGTATFTNNSGGTFNVSGFLTAATGTTLVTSLKNLADGSTVSGTTSITQSASLFIPANTFTVGDAFRFTMRVRKAGTAGITTVRAYVNTANNLTGALQLSVASSTSANHLYAQHKREVWVKSATNTETMVSTGNSGSDDVSISNFSNTNINWAVDQYLILSINNASTADATIGAGIVVEKI